MHLDRHPDIKTFIDIDNEIIRWSRDTVEGRKFTKSCDRVEARHTASSFFHGAPIVQEDEEQDEYNQHSSSLTDNQRNGATRGRGGARGRDATGRNPNQTRGITQSKDAEGYNQYQQGQDGKILLNEKGHPRCNYCGIPSHRRDACRIKQKDFKTVLRELSTPVEVNCSLTTNKEDQHWQRIRRNHGQTEERRQLTHQHHNHNHR
jgi:hypothetical protein